MKVFGLLIIVTVLFAFGCTQQSSAPTPTVPTNSTSNADGHAHEHVVNGWCVEHGVPEDDCTQCSAKAAEKHQKDGDWCEEHDRAESQCFICEPKRQEEFAAQYKAQFGTDLPQPHNH